MRAVVRALVWRDDLCQTQGGLVCPEANTYRCRACGEEFESPREDRPRCPGCGGACVRQRCAECPLTRLDEALESGQGQVIRRAYDWLSMAEMGMAVSADDVDAEEFRVMQMIRGEQARRDRQKDAERDGR